MATFEEYRQPWETGPHWELKREFMEKYKNDYPLDRLLCLAQAYSNIELLHCSYPEPVEREVYQLSCQLQGCKRFREAAADLERRKKEKQEMQPRKAGKRSSSDEISTTPFKFIKFCSPAVALNQSDSNNQSDKNSEDFIQHDTKASTNDSRTSVDSQDLNKNSVSEYADSNGVALPSSNKRVIFSLSQSPDFGLIQKIAAAIPKKSGTSLIIIESAVEGLGLENAVKYVFVRENTSVICCQFYIGSTLIATGRDTNEKLSKERAVQYGVEILTSLLNLPYKTLEDVKQELENWKKATNVSQLWFQLSSSDLKLKSQILKSQLSEMEKYPGYDDLYLILGLISKLSEEKYMKSKQPALQKILEAATKLKYPSQVYFFHFGEDPDTLLHERAFHCDFVIKNILICHSKATSKKKSRSDVAEQGLRLLTNFIENEKQTVQDQVQSVRINLESSKAFVTDISTYQSLNNYLPKRNTADTEYSSANKKIEFNKLHKDSKAENYLKTFVPSSKCHNQGSSGLISKPKIFRINHKLLANSRNQQLVIFDLSETSCAKNASSILNNSVNRCKKNLNYEIEDIPADASRNSPRMLRCSYTLNGEEIGRAHGFTEKETKSLAAENALEFLQNHVYTIKVKNEIEESFIISRSHVINSENPSSVLSESNVGCKMLKMMGWTGGGIGKTSGITEPIAANDHTFGQGLGFSNNKAQGRSFKQKIEALLKDYSKSNTMSDLIFSTEFSKEERSDIHRLATKYHLLNNSRGKGQQRQLFIGRKISPMELLERLIEAGGSTPKYELEDRSISIRTSVSQ